MKVKVLTLVVSKKKIKIHESVLDMQHQDRTAYTEISRKLRLAWGLSDATFICFAEGSPEFFVSKGLTYDEDFAFPFMDFFNEVMIQCSCDYNTMKAHLIDTIRTTFANPEGSGIFNLCLN